MSIRIGRQGKMMVVPIALSLVCLVVVLKMSGSVGVAVGAASRLTEASWLHERRLIGLGIFMLTLVLAILMLWKLPMRRDVGGEALVTFASVNHQTPWRALTNEQVGGPQVATPQLRMTLNESADELLAKGQAEHLVYSAEGVHAWRQPLRRSQTPLSRERMGCKGWATGVHSPEVRRALKRTPGARGYRGTVPIARRRHHEDTVCRSQVRVLRSTIGVQQRQLSRSVIECAATVLQPEQGTPGPGRKIRAEDKPKSLTQSGSPTGQYVCEKL